MSFTIENIVDIVSANPEEAVAVFKCFHQMNSGLSAFNIICKENGIKKPRGGYKGKKRTATAYNLFTKEMYGKDKDEIMGLGDIGNRGKHIGDLWRKLDDKEKEKYKEMAKKLKDENGDKDEKKEDKPKPKKKAAPKKKKEPEPKVEDDSDDDVLDDSDIDVDSDDED